MESPWTRIREYMHLLSSLQLHTAKNHADQVNIEEVSNAIKDLHLHVKQVNFLPIEQMKKKYAKNLF